MTQVGVTSKSDERQRGVPVGLVAKSGRGTSCLPPTTFDYDPRVQMERLLGPNWQAMIPTPGWIHITHEHHYCEKVCCGCVVGHYCNTQAHVLPGGDIALQQLTYLTLRIASVQYSGAPFPSGVPFFDANSPWNPKSVGMRGPNVEMPPPQIGQSKDFNSLNLGIRN
jgi:hypothetical protein